MSSLALGVSRATRERVFYTGFAWAVLVTVFVGFSRSFFLRPFFPDWPRPAEPIFILHGLVFTSWCVLLLAQVSLVRAARTDVHRQLGVIAVVIAPAIVVLGVTGALIAAHRPTGFVGIPVPARQFLVIPLLDMTLFATFIALALARRRDPQAHKRWMVLATVNLLTAAIARWPGVLQIGNPLVYFALTDLYIVALAVFDLRSRGRLHPVTLAGGLTIIASQPLRLALSGTPAWMEFATWATSLVA